MAREFFERDEDDDGGRRVLRNGETLRVPALLMDHHRVNEIIRDALHGGDGEARLVDAYGRVLACVPDRAARDAADAARERRIQRTCDAWRKKPAPRPAPDPTRGWRSAGPGSGPVMPADAAEARRLADAAWERKRRRTQDAWRRK